MKHLNTLKISAFAFIACLLMNSCSTNNEFAKQKYTNFKHSKHHSNPTNNNDYQPEVIAKKEVTLPLTASTSVVTPDINLKTVDAPAIKGDLSNQDNAVKKSAANNNTKDNVVTPDKKTLAHIGKFATFRAFKATASALKTGKAPASGDVDLVILVILAIFIPPLAVYLKEGATSRFVIDLILALIGIFGLWWFPFAGLAYLAAIIIALIAVLK